MKVLRKVRMNVDHFEVGDQITVNLKGYGKFTATCHRLSSGDAIFAFDNCICRKPMNETDTNEGGFPESDLCKWLNSELINAFPEEYRKRMLCMDDCFLWLLSEEEVFGADLPFDNQLELMKDPKHRVCSYPDGTRAHWWLRDVCYSTSFALVSANGAAYHSSALYSDGVRPAFAIENI